MLEYDLVEGYIDRRATYRPEHLELARAYSLRGELRLAGAVGEPIDRAWLVFTGPDASVAEGFARADPYVRQGLVTAWRVRPWAVVIGADYQL